MSDSENCGTAIRSATENDFGSIYELCTERFGKGYIDLEKFRRWLEFPELFLVIEKSGNFAGYVCFVPESPEELADILHLSPEFVRNAAGGRPVIHCRSTAIRREYEHKGYMRLLWSEIIGRVKKLGYRAALGPAWRYGGTVPMERLLVSFGFEVICEREKIWYDEEDYECVVCHGRCACDAVIYMLKISDGDE